MLTKNDLKQIRVVVKEEIQEEVKPIKKQLDTVEMKVELVNKRVGQAQDETIDALSELINTGYDIHEKRIRKIESVLQIPSPQQ